MSHGETLHAICVDWLTRHPAASRPPGPVYDDALFSELRTGHVRERILDGRFLAWLLTDERARGHLPALGLTFEQVNIVGPFETAFQKIDIPLNFETCAFDTGINICMAELKSLRFNGGSLKLLDAAGVAVKGDLIVEGIACGPVDLEDAKIEGDVRFTGARVTAEKADAKSTESALVKLKIGLGFRNPPRPTMPIDGALSLDRADIAGRVFLSASRDGTPFCAEGCVYMRNTKIGGILDCQGGRFLGGKRYRPRAGLRSTRAIYAESCSIGGPVYLGTKDLWNPDRQKDPPSFRAIGCVDFAEAQIGGSMVIGSHTDREPTDVGEGKRRPRAAVFLTARESDYFGAAPAPSLNLTGVRIGGDLTMVDVRAFSFVKAINSTIGSNIRMENATIGLRNRARKHIETARSLFLHGMRLGDTMFVESCCLLGTVSMIGASLGGELYIGSSRLYCSRKTVSQGFALGLRSASVGRVWLYDIETAPGMPKKASVRPTVVEGRVRFAHARIRDDLWFKDAVIGFGKGFDGEFLFEVDEALVDISNAHIGGDLDCGNGRFGTEETEKFFVFAANAARITGSVRLSMKVEKNAAASAPAEVETRFWGGVAIRNAEIGGSLHCSAVGFETEGCPALNISGTTIKGNLRCRGASFTLYPVFEEEPKSSHDSSERTNACVIIGREATVGGNVNLTSRSKFYGSLDFSGVAVGGNFDCQDAQFRLPTAREKLSREQENAYAAVKESYSALKLARAKIAGDFCWFEEEKRGQGPFKPEGILNLQGARIGRLYDRSVWWPDVPVHRLRDLFNPPVFVQRQYLRLDGLVYDRLHEESVREPGRSAWLLSQDPNRFSLQPYEQFVKVLRQMGHHQEANMVALAKQGATRLVAAHRERIAGMKAGAGTRAKFHELHRVQSLRRSGLMLLFAAIGLLIMFTAFIIAFPTMLPNVFAGYQFAHAKLRSLHDNAPWEAISIGYLLLLAGGFVLMRCLEQKRLWVRARVSRLWNWTLDAVAGHGYRPIRAVWLAIGVIFFGAIVFENVARPHFQPVQIRQFIATDDKISANPVPPANYPAFSPLLYSIELFVPFLNINQNAFWTLRGDAPLWVRYYKVLHTVLGWILSTIIALSPIPLFRKD